MKKPGFIIIGFSKCGQTSLETYLNKRYPSLINRKLENAWAQNAVETYLEKYGHAKYQPIFITRDPIERIWSGYHYFHWDSKELPYREQYTFPEYLELKDYRYHIGELNPISQSNYSKWIRPWLKLNPIVISVEDMEENPNFPHLNKTEDIRNIQIKPIPEEFKKLAREKLGEEIKKNQEPSWSKIPNILK